MSASLRNLWVAATGEEAACLKLAENSAETLMLLTMHLRQVEPTVTPRTSAVNFLIRVYPVPESERLALAGSVAYINVQLREQFVGPLDMQRRAELLDLYCGELEALVIERGWSVIPLQNARAAAVRDGLRFRWAGVEKWNRSKNCRAHSLFYFTEENQLVGKIQITDPAGNLLKESASLPAFGTLEGLKRASKTLSWSDHQTVTMTPYGDRYGVNQDIVKANIP